LSGDHGGDADVVGREAVSANENDYHDSGPDRRNKNLSKREEAIPVGATLIVNRENGTEHDSVGAGEGAEARHDVWNLEQRPSQALCEGCCDKPIAEAQDSFLASQKSDDQRPDEIELLFDGKRP
jgi:hypothetical protein